jgi:hypothetical protein
MATLLIVAATFALSSCNGKTDGGDGDGDGDGAQQEIENNMTFTEYMRKINSGLVSSGTYMDELSDYHVKSEYTIYTSTENYTLTYEAVYKENKQDGRYLVRLFDNDNHIERLYLYYDGKDLYVTQNESHYTVSDFSSMLSFGLFTELIDKIDFGSFFYGKIMTDNFSETGVLASVFGINDCNYRKAGENGESVNMSNGDLSLLIGRVNAYITVATEDIGTTFDAPSMYYLGFRLSKLLEYKLSSVVIEDINFLFDNSLLTSTYVKADGRMQDNSKYFIEASYKYDTETTAIADGDDVKSAYAYENLSFGTGSYDGTVSIPGIRDTDFNVSLDYDLNATDNTKNSFAFRIYDQNNSHAGSGADKYADINELLCVYYADEKLYINTEGLYDYVGAGIGLAALHLPKVYVEGIDLTSIMSLFYSDAIRAVRILLDSEERQIEANKKFYEAFLAAVTSDVDKTEISLEITEDLIKSYRGDDTDMSVLIGRLLGLTDQTVKKYVGDSFFQYLKAILTYNFTSKLFTTEIIYDTDTVATFNTERVAYNGVVLPADLNDLNYTELAEPDVITLDYDVKLNPYGAENVDLSKFFGAFIGDASGLNTDVTLKTGEYLVMKGKVSEFYVYDTDGNKTPATTVDLKFYRRTGTGTANVKDTLLMSLATNPADITQFLVGLYIDLGDYENAGGLFFRIPRETVSEQLDEIVGGDNIFGSTTTIGTLLSIYDKLNGNCKTYTENGYYCVSLTASADSDPVKEIVGIENAYTVMKTKIGFETLDLSGLKTDEYVTPYINTLSDVSADSIYSTGSRWKDSAAVYIDGNTVNMKLTYTAESTTISTGTKDYSPRAYLFGQEISYALHIVDETGAYVVKELDLTDNLLVIDPAFTKTVPTEIGVRYDNYETGELECTIDGFYDVNITNSGYNMALLAGDFSDENTKYTLHIGTDSIAEKDIEIYIAVICRNVQPVEEKNSDGTTSPVYVTADGGQLPVVAQIDVDPYAYSMRLAADGKYDLIASQLSGNGTKVLFDSLYGQKEVVDETTKETVYQNLYYDKQGYNWMYLSDLDLDWTFDTSAVTWQGGIAYAYACYGDKENGYAVPLEIEVFIASKVAEYVLIDGEDPGVYTIDYLIEETYAVPVETGGSHTVTIVFKDGTSKYIGRTRPGTLSDEEYYSTYIKGQLNWIGISGLSSKITEEGASALFGTGENATDTTTAEFGAIGGIGQEVSLRIIIPSRSLSENDVKDKYLVTAYSESQTAEYGTVGLSNAKFSESDGAYDPYEINPYDATAALPSTIWLYVPTTRAVSGVKVWKEYDVQWVTTDKNGAALEIIKNDGGRFVLANPGPEEKLFVVYGKVGDGNGSIWVTMSVKNLESSIKSITLYVGTKEFDISSSVAVDPYLSYAASLPDKYKAILGSGNTVTNISDVTSSIDWYVTYNGEKYPIRRAADTAFSASRYNGVYGSDGYFIFPKEGGSFALTMYVSAQGISNEVTINATAAGRTLMYSTEYKDSAYVFVSDYIDIYGKDGYADGTTYTGAASAGYLDVDCYKQDSSLLTDRLIELLGNGGAGLCGIAFAETGETKLYSKTVKWNTDALQKTVAALQSMQGACSFMLDGVIDENKINEQDIKIKITLHPQTLSSVELTRAGTLIDEGVYSVKNDVNADGKLGVDELDNVAIASYYRGDAYDRYFGTSGGYGESDFDYVIFFDVGECYRFSTSGARLYVSPYTYFSYLFGSVALKFESGSTTATGSSLSLNGVTEKYFNDSVLGLDADTVVADGTGAEYSYSFLVLEKLSRGSVINRVAVIIVAETAERTTQQQTENVNVFNDDLTETYAEGYDLPLYVEVGYKTSGGNEYTAKYATASWLAASGSVPALGSGELTKIAKEKINVINETSYQFVYTLPDTGGDFIYVVNFLKKDIGKVNYSATGKIALYDVTDGVITVPDAYLFLTRNGDNDFGFDTTQIPTVIDAYTDTGAFASEDSASYNVTWTFVKTSFTEDIFRNGTEKTLIAVMRFGSYYDASGERYTQTVELYVKIEPLEFYGIEYEGLTVVTDGDTSENPVYDTIEIDPYNDANGYNGKFVLPTEITVLFNSGTQKFTFTDVTYQLRDSEGASDRRAITSIEYDENGHKLTGSYITDQYRAVLSMKIYGFTTGVTIYVDFLQRLINSVRISNRCYESDGSYLYEKNALGSTVFDGDNPVIKSYYAYAGYSFVSDDGAANASGRMPVYYIDPYNTASFRLPETVTLDFATEKGVFSTYKIAGWQAYDASVGAYVDFASVRTASAASALNFYRLSSGGASFYNLTGTDYKGAEYLLRGYISVGGSNQYFEVVAVVLNRSLRAGVTLGDAYTVNYDFDDPIEAMLSDIPNILGETMFVEYDRYCENFAADGIYDKTAAGRYTFTIDGDNLFTRTDGGTTYNEAVIPSILWEDEYDTDGDGDIDTTFDDFTTTGYSGGINGNVYYKASDLAALIEYYTESVNAGYATLIKALMWDAFFNNGEVSGAYSATARSAIEKNAELLFRDQVNAAYDLTLSNVSAQYADYMKNDLMTAVLQEVNKTSAVLGKIYDLSVESDRRYIVYCLYNDLEDEYDTWAAAGGVAANATSKTEIFAAWEKYLGIYTSADVTTNSAVSANQILKAGYYDAVTSGEGNFNTDEKARIEKSYAQQKALLYIYINADVWEAVYDAANVFEKARMDSVLDECATANGDGDTSKSLAIDKLSLYLSSYEELGVTGEEAAADITVPVIDYEKIVESPIDLTAVTAITFNKFNFDSIDSSFVVQFRLSYKNIFEEKIKEATEKATDKYRDGEAITSLENYSETYLAAVIDSIVPKVLNAATGEYEPLSSMKASGKIFGYDWLTIYGDDTLYGGNDTAENYYAALWNTLYSYYQDFAVYYVTSNIAGVDCYADIANLSSVSSTEWGNIVGVYEYLAKESDASAATKKTAAFAEAQDALYKSTDPAKNITALAAVRNLVDYIIGIDGKLNEMDGYADDAYGKLCAELAPKLLGNNYSAVSAIGKAMSAVGGGDMAKGAAIMFSRSYLDLATSVKTNWSSVVYDMLYDTFYDADEEAYTNSAFEILVQNYHTSDYAYPDGVVVYLALNSADAVLADAAETYFDFVIGYVASDVSPYDEMKENSSLIGIDSAVIEGGADSLLSCAITDASRLSAISGVLTERGIASEETVNEKFKKYTLYKAVKDKLESDGASSFKYFAEWEAEALLGVRHAAVDSLFRYLLTAYPSAYTSLVGYYEHNDEEFDAQAFAELVDAYRVKGLAVENTFESYIDDYDQTNLRKSAKAILDALYDAREGRINSGVTDVMSVEYVYTRLYGKYMSRKSYVTYGDPTDDVFNDAYLAKEGETLCDNYGVTYNANVLNGYMKDYLLRGIVYYGANVATAGQKLILAEVIGAYTGATYTAETIGSFDIEKSVLKYVAANVSGITFGNALYKALGDRYDMGDDCLGDVLSCYFLIWLDEMMGSIKYDVTESASFVLTSTSLYQRKVEDLSEIIMETTGETVLTDEEQTAVEIMADKDARSDVWENAVGIMGGYTAQYNTQVAAMRNDAGYYAYYEMYDAQNESGGYIYRDGLDGELEKIVEKLVTESYYKDVYDILEENFVNEKLGVMDKAAGDAVKTLVYADLYGDIKLLALSSDDFAADMYAYLTGEAGDTAKLLGADKDGAGGLIGDIRTYGANDAVYAEYLQKLDEWWKTDGKEAENTVYGLLSTNEQQFVYEVYLQSYYRAGNAGETERRYSARLGTVISLYLFLCDLSDYVDANMPEDYFSASNADEYKAYVVEEMLTSDVMRNSGHSLSLARAVFASMAVARAKETAVSFVGMTGSGTVFTGEESTFEDYIDVIVSALTRDTCAATGEHKAEYEALYAEYLAKAVRYVGYTSAAGNDYYDETAANPLYKYADYVYETVTGYAIGATVATGNAAASLFGYLSGSYYVDKESTYQAALEAMLEDRYVTETFYSEDSYDKNDENQRRHVVYFDRTTWEEFVADNPSSIAQTTVANSNLFFANADKTGKITVVGGYVYENSFKAEDITFALADITTVKVRFDGENADNTLSIDALAPELPSSAHATGYIEAATGTIVVDLGYIEITGYSDSFNELVYSPVTRTGDDAYYITLKADSNTEMKVVLTVIFLDRSIKELYVDSDMYSESPAKIEDPLSDFVDMYPLYITGADGRKDNVVYIDPTNTDVLNSAGSAYIMPSSLAVLCGSGDKVVFTDVAWDMSKVNYSISGTKGSYVSVNILSYKYEDADGNTREILYDYDTCVVTMKIYGAATGTLTSTQTYQLALDTMVDWNVCVYVEDRSVKSVEYYSDGGYVALGAYSGVYGNVDASESGYTVNPYYAEYPSKIRIYFGANDYEDLTLSASDWTLAETNALINIISDGYEAGDTGRNLVFTARFAYLGYKVAVTFRAMDIKLPSTGTEYIDGGTLYLVKGQDSASVQLSAYYSYMYYNFGTNDEPDRQKVPLAFDSVDVQSVSVQKVNTYAGVTGIIGVTKTGVIDKNIKFTIKVIDPKDYAVLSSGYNGYVSYDYYSVPKDGSNNKKTTAEEPDTMGDTYILSEDGSTVKFTAGTDLSYDFVENTVDVTLSYALEDTVDSKLSYDAAGTRIRKFVLTMPMKAYLYVSVTSPSFNTDATGKKWTWTSVPVTSPSYTDAVYWPIGQAMTASDLPTAVIDATGAEISLKWDLSDLNVNRANVEGTVAGAEDGTVVYGYYMLSNGTWSSLALTVYIMKTDVMETILGIVNGEGGHYITKSYDGQFYELPFDASKLKYLRDDGTVTALGENSYEIAYLDADDAEQIWKTDVFPIDAGTYYIRLTFSDYNVYMGAGSDEENPWEEDWMFRLVITPYVVDVSDITFSGEKNNSVEFVYDGSGNYLAVNDGCLPEITVDNWFAAGEKETLVSAYRTAGYSETDAKAKSYAVIYERVSEGVRAVMDGWYDTVRENGVYTSDSGIKARVYDYYMVYNLTVVETSVTVTYKFNGEVVAAPTDVGTYTAAVDIDTVGGNYAAKNSKMISLIVVKDETISYYASETSLTYSGDAQNVPVNGLHKNGSIPAGVKITYTYTFGETTLVVVNDSNNIYVDAALSSEGVDTTQRGIKNVGSYNCRVDINGGTNYISGSFTTAVAIKKASVYIAIGDITTYYLDSVADLSDYVTVYSAANASGSAKYLYGADKLADLGALSLYTDVQSFYPSQYLLYVYQGFENFRRKQRNLYRNKRYRGGLRRR